MKPAALIAVAALLVAAPAAAQNAGQIASVRGGASCAGCNLFQADLGNLTLKGKNLSRARLRQSEMSAGIFNGTTFAGADLRDVNAYGALFTSANLTGADLTNATFVGAYLQGAKMSGANLSGTNFSGAEMDRAIGLTQSQLNKACGDDSTRLPRGMRIPSC
jgi:uncharacterized protein YjbI with pentapeptide repeats